MLKVLCRKCGRHNVGVGQSSAVIKVVVVVDDKTTYDWIIGRDLKKKKITKNLAFGDKCWLRRWSRGWGLVDGVRRLSFARYGHHREDERYSNRDGVEYSRTHRLQPVSPHRYWERKLYRVPFFVRKERLASGDQRTCVDDTRRTVDGSML
jgi:hypothetical protein